MQHFSFLVVGKTNESTESLDGKKFVGVGSSYVMAVNPTKEELEKIYNVTLDAEPEYTKSEEGKADSIRIDFIVRTDPEQCNGIDNISHATIFLANEGVYNKENTKMQVIDEYGNTAWGLIDDVKAGKKLFYEKDGEMRPCTIADKYRPAYRGEGDLVAFLKAYLGINDVFSYNKEDGSWIMASGNTDEFKFSLEHIKDYFKGNVSEIKEALKLQPKNKVKLGYGVRTTDKGQFQDVFTREGMVVRNKVSNVKAANTIAKQFKSAKESGAFADTEFEAVALKEYKPQTTNLNKPVDDKMPWD